VTFTAPFTAVPGEIITAAGWNTSARDNINHIWGVIGGNPGTSGYVVHSTGASSGAWGKVTDDLLNDQKISQTAITATDANAITAGSRYVLNIGADANTPFDSYWYVDHIRYATGYYWQLASSIIANDQLWMRTVVAGVPNPWVRVWTASSDGSGSGLDADLFRGLVPGNASGNIPINNGVANINLNAALLAGLSPGNASGQIPISNGVLNTNLAAATAATASNALLLNGFVQGNGAGNIPINNFAQSAGLNSQYLQSLTPGNGSGNIPISNGTVNTGLRAQYADNLGTSPASAFARFELVAWAGDGTASRLITLASGAVPKYVRILGITGAAGVVTCDIYSTGASNNVKLAGTGASVSASHLVTTRIDNVFGGFRVDAADFTNDSAFSYTALCLY